MIYFICGNSRYNLPIHIYNIVLREIVANYYGISKFNTIRKENHLMNVNFPKQFLKIENIEMEKAIMIDIIKQLNDVYPSIYKFLLCNDKNIIWSPIEVKQLHKLLNSIDFSIISINQTEWYNLDTHNTIMEFVNFLSLCANKNLPLRQISIYNTSSSLDDDLKFISIDTLKQKKKEAIDNINQVHDNIYDLYHINYSYTPEEISLSNSFFLKK